MSDRQDREEHKGPLEMVRGVVGAIALVAVLKSMEKKEEAADEPEMISDDPLVKELDQLARGLAKDNHNDDDCVKALVVAAGRHKRALSKAAARVRFLGGAKESRIRDRANRLLLAAATGQSVRQLSVEENTLFARIEDLKLRSVYLQKGFATLTDLKPELRDLEQRFAGPVGDAIKRKRMYKEFDAALADLVAPLPKTMIPFCEHTQLTTWYVDTFGHGTAFPAIRSGTEL